MISCQKKVIGFAIDVHRELGPGLLESTYEKCLAHELKAHNIEYVTQMTLPVEYKGLSLDCGYRVVLVPTLRVGTHTDLGASTSLPIRRRSF